jgi:hypothetical protein
VRDYDLAETSKLVRVHYPALLSSVDHAILLVHCLYAGTQIKGVFTSVAMMAFLHLYLKYSQPLFVQAIMAFKSLYEAKTVKIHVLGRNAEGDLKRPFKAGAGLFGGACAPPVIAFTGHLTTRPTQRPQSLRRTRPPSKKPKNELVPRRSDKVFLSRGRGETPGGDLYIAAMHISVSHIP